MINKINDNINGQLYNQHNDKVAEEQHWLQGQFQVAPGNIKKTQQ